MDRTDWVIVISIVLAFLVSAAIVFLPPFWLTLMIGFVAFLFTLSNPLVGMIMLLTVLQYSVFPTVRVGPVEFSASTVPVVGMVMGAAMRQRKGIDPALEKWQKNLLVLLSGVFVITSLLSADYEKTLSFFPNLVIYIFVLFGVMSAVNRPEHLVTLAKTIIVLTVIATFWRELSPLRGLVGIPSLGVNGMIFGIYPAMGICLTLVSKPLEGFSSRWRWLALFALAAMAYRVLTFEARAGALAGIVLLGIVAIVYRAFFKPLYVFSLIAVLLLANIFFQDVVKTNLVETQATVEASLSADDPTGRIDKADQLRLVSRDAALRMFSERPLTGWGPNLYIMLKPSFAIGPQYLFTDKTVGAFDAWLIVLAEMGLVGILATGLTVVTPVFISFHALRVYQDDLAQLAFAFALGVIGLSIHLFFIDLFYSYAWTHIALAIAAARLSLRPVGNRSLVTQNPGVMQPLGHVETMPSMQSISW